MMQQKESLWEVCGADNTRHESTSVKHEHLKRIVIEIAANVDSDLSLWLALALHINDHFM